jgi:hypothetical protein
MAKKLTDIEAYDRLHAAMQRLGDERALTPAADTALRSARLALVAFQIAIVRAMETPPKAPLPPPPY